MCLLNEDFRSIRACSLYQGFHEPSRLSPISWGLGLPNGRDTTVSHLVDGHSPGCPILFCYGGEPCSSTIFSRP